MDNDSTETAPSALPIIKNVDTDPGMQDSGISTDYTTDKESIASSTYASRHGKRRSNGLRLFLAYC